MDYAHYTTPALGENLQSFTLIVLNVCLYLPYLFKYRSQHADHCLYVPINGVARKKSIKKLFWKTERFIKCNKCTFDSKKTNFPAI